MNRPEYNDSTQCHCSESTAIYRRRKIWSKAFGGGERIFHRCPNCASRFFHDAWPKMDSAKTVGLMEIQAMLRKTDHNKILEQ